MAWPVFPVCPSYGFTKRANYSVTIIERSSGIRTVNRNWYYPLHTFSAIPIDTRPDDDIALIIRFWHAIGGQAGQFLIKDYTDFKSSNNPRLAVTGIDQPLAETDVANVWQLMKIYEDEEFIYEQQRLIQKPKTASIIIMENGVALTVTTDYTIDYETGLVTIIGSHPGVLTWGGEFYVPVMFESTPEFMVVNWRTQSTSFALCELRLPQPTFVSSS